MAKIDPVVTENLPKSDRSFELLPAGWYAFTITEADVKSKSKEHTRLGIRCDVTGPSHQGRVVFTGFNLRNPSEEAQRISMQQFGELLRAIGLAKCDDSDQLVGKRFMGKVKVRPAKGDYEESNDIAGFKAIEGGMPTSPSAPAATGAKPSASKPPWAK